MSENKSHPRLLRLFSGIQPTGDIHLGNYLGAIQYWVRLQEEYDSIFSIVDMHAITTPQDPQILKRKTRETAGLLLASGIDPERSALFIQSHISVHAELAWILNCLTPLGWMRRMTQFKEKSATGQGEATMGLFDYPVLMASDILLYETDLVPVGADQKQHLEITREIAKRFNLQYGKTFRLPTPLIPDTGARIMGLDNPMKKMSKSLDRGVHAIHVLDTPENIRSKIMKAKTDSMREIRFDKNRHGIFNLLVIYERLTGAAREDVESRFQGKGYAAFKRELSEIVIETLRPIQLRYRHILKERGLVDRMLLEGARKVEPIALRVISTVKGRVGLG